jgi:hypothetical protein
MPCASCWIGRCASWAIANCGIVFSERLIYTHELVLLACHVRQNLWIDDRFGGMMLEDNITGSVEIAMLAQRRGIAGERTPQGSTHRVCGDSI